MSSTPAPLTPEQSAALRSRGVAVALDAGAGCGKTFVLTRRYLAHLDPPEGEGRATHPAEVVALTFTEAAAREMRSRIRTTCLQRSKEGGADADHWAGVARSLDSARISTIHAFCNTLVKEHAIELGLAPGYRVMDGAEASAMLSDSVDQVFTQLLEQRDERLISAAAAVDLQTLRDQVIRLAGSAEETGFASWAARTPEEAMAAWRAFYQEEIVPAGIATTTNSKELRNYESVLRLAKPLTEGFADRVAEALDIILKLRTGKGSAADMKRLGSLARVRGQEEKKTFCTKKDWPSDEVSKQHTVAASALRDLIEKCLSEPDETNWREAASHGLYVLGLAVRGAEAFRVAKRSAEAIDFDDQIGLAHRLLTRPEFERVRRSVEAGVQAVLVDEFQDTDRKQLEIVRALAGEDWDRGRLFFVGDFKQSIYRFRGAEPNVFRELQEITPAAGRLALTANFRSTPGVIDFVNALFGEAFAPSYRPLQAQRPQLVEGPAVEFLWTHTPQQNKVAASEGRRAEAAVIAQRIAEIVESGEPLIGAPGGFRPARFGDFCVLFRALSDVALYESALQEAGLPYYLVGGHSFYNQQEVFDVLNLLRAVMSDQDEVSLAGALRSPFFALQDETLYWMVQKWGSLQRAMVRATPPELEADEAAKLDRAKGILQELRRASRTAGAAQLLTLAIDRTAYDAALTLDFLGERKLANLRKLIDQASEVDATPSGGLRTFVGRLADSLNRLTKEAQAAATTSDADLVRLMTVHQSKGLEFPIVFVADLQRKRRDHHEAAMFHPSLGPLVRRYDRQSAGGAGGHAFVTRLESEADREEAERLFYVATTRAADRLILSSWLEDINNSRGEWLTLLERSFDLRTGERTCEPSLAQGETEAPPLVEVRMTGPPSGKQPTKAGRIDRSELVAKARDLAGRGGGIEPTGARPIPADSSAQRRFSVSRISGRLYGLSSHAESSGAERSSSEHRAAVPGRVDAAGLGTLVHALLERAPLDGAKFPVREFAEAIAPQHVPLAPAEAARVATRLVGRFMRTDRFAAMQRAQRTLRELEFVLPWQELIGLPGVYLQGYLDCLCEEAPGVWRIVDYKTNNIQPEEAQQETERYRLQLGVYALAVERSLGVSPRELTLHFLRPEIEVTIPWDDAFRVAVIEGVNAQIFAAWGGADPAGSSPSETS